MIDRKEQLQKAIMTNDMGLVVDFYEFVFGEKAPKNLSSQTKSNKLVEDIQKAISILTNHIEPVTETKQAKTKNPAKIVEAERQKEEDQSEDGTRFISSKEFELPEDSIPEYAEAMKKLSKRKKTTRDPYLAKMIKCDACSREFDYNKEYPVGQLESGANAKIKCNKCRSK